MNKSTCSIDGCDSPVVARTWCNAHYHMWRKHGDPLIKTPPAPETCTFEGCDRQHSGHGYCGGHLAQLRRGAELRPLRSNGRGGGVCSECPEPAVARGWCRIHYWHWFKYGDPLKGAPERPRMPEKCTYAGCGRPYAYSGYCDSHARQLSRHEELRPISDHRKYVIDHHYFDVIDTEEKAYWLGFFTADGCVVSSTELTINLQAQDAGHLEKLSASLSSDYPVRPTTSSPKSGPAVRWDASSPYLVRALGELGVTPRKSATVVPWQGPDSLMRHYWRGMVDGDGCLSRFRSRPSAPKNQWALFLSGSRACVEGFAAWAGAICGSRAQPRRTQAVGGCWYWTVGGNRMAVRVIRELYGDCSVSLDRKQVLADMALGR